MIILSGATLEEAATFGATLSDVLRAREILVGAPDFCLAISAGFAEAGRGSRLEDLVSAASSGRNPLGKFDICSPVEEP